MLIVNYSFWSILLIVFIEFWSTIVWGGISLKIIEPDLTKLFSPIVTPGLIIDPGPMKDPDLIFTGLK